MDMLWTLLRVIVAFGVVLALMLWLRAKAGKFTRRKTGTVSINVRARQSLGAKATVSVVDIGGRRYILGSGEAGVSVIDADAIPEAEFAALLDTAEQEQTRTEKNPPPPAAGMPGEKPTFLAALGIAGKQQFGIKR
ncbi:flagellar biosynthetic protein FliO [Curtobacterium sp. MCSS17_016]|uniref:FliO/MopB family protein n=1 Tax=Curtobacterium sp. MCSS17_016 TaxID=2175644 RepID=UPI000DA8CAB6|nr:flagellar biosynthetic protein FliO [Curtobacterium sp. MCSS17_016]WIE80899.1 flagellar biosynthetic protein FliO [Curtobacterium sp. MCSS17_016]